MDIRTIYAIINAQQKVLLALQQQILELEKVSPAVNRDALSKQFEEALVHMEQINNLLQVGQPPAPPRKGLFGL